MQFVGFVASLPAQSNASAFMMQASWKVSLISTMKLSVLGHVTTGRMMHVESLMVSIVIVGLRTGQQFSTGFSSTYAIPRSHGCVSVTLTFHPPFTLFSTRTGGIVSGIVQ